MKQARSIRFTPPAILRHAFAGFVALVLGFSPLIASAQVPPALGGACAAPDTAVFGPNGGGILVCNGGVWRVGLINNFTLNNVLIGTADAALPTGNFNVAVGRDAGMSITSGADNVAVGTSALDAVTTTASNTAIGHAALSSTTGSNNTALGRDAGWSIGAGSGNIAIGENAQVPNGDGNYQVRIGGTFITYAGVRVAWTITSDRRIKQDIQDTDLGLDFIRKLRPVSYRLKDGNERLDYGFIAQDVEQALDGRITNMVTQMGDEMKTYQLRHNDLIAPLVKAVQEQQQFIEKQQKQIDALEKTIQRLAP